MTNDAILFRALWTIKPGKVEDAKREAKAFTEAVHKAQPGTRVVSAAFSPDGKTLVVHEVHHGEAGVKAHLAGSTVPTFMPRFMAVADIAGFEAYGKLSPEVEGMIKPFNPKVYAPAASYTR
jgi:quinol monooxygenase YgiN